MRVVLGHRIALNPTGAQERFLAQSLGTARFAWNWALAEWQKQYKTGGKPNQLGLRRQLNEIKRGSFPWMTSVSKSVPQHAVINLGRAFERFFKKKSKHPRFKKRTDGIGARLDNGPGTFVCEETKIRLPKVGWIKTHEALRFSGKPLSVTLSRVAHRWFVTVAVQFENGTSTTLEARSSTGENQAVGIDLGLTAAATLSTGEKYLAPKPLKKGLKALRRASKRHSRKVKGSRNRCKSAMRLARRHARIANIRNDWNHKVTTGLVRRFDVIGIEDLNVRGLMRNRHLARAMADVGMYEFRRQIAYKCDIYGKRLVVADRWFPSSKTCSECGSVVEALPLSVREWTCECGAVHDRDRNAAKNLERIALDTVSCTGIYACGEEGSGRGLLGTTKPSSKKQELNCDV